MTDFRGVVLLASLILLSDFLYSVVLELVSRLFCGRLVSVVWLYDLFFCNVVGLSSVKVFVEDAFLTISLGFDFLGLCA